MNLKQKPRRNRHQTAQRKTAETRYFEIATKSLAHVMVVLGHKSWSSAQLYVDLVEAISAGPEEHVSAVDKTLEEALKLTDSGFDYVTDWENVKT